MDYNCYLVNLCSARTTIYMQPSVWLTCLQYTPTCDLRDPRKFVTLSVNMPMYWGLNAGEKKGTVGPLEGSPTHCLPHPHPHYLHLALHTCADTSNPILACTKCIRPKWPRVYVLLGENTDRKKVGAESTAGKKEFLILWQERKGL